MEEARSAFEGGFIVRALAAYDAAGEARPADPAVEVQRARLLAALGHGDEALPLFSRAEELASVLLAQEPSNTAALRARARARIALSRFDEALEDARRAAELEPAPGEDEELIGTVEGLRGSRVLAERNHRRAVELSPNDALLRVQFGDSMLRLGDADGASAIYSAALDRWPENPLLHHQLGMALAAEGRHAEALAELDRSCELEPENPVPHANRAAALLYLGRLSSGADAVRTALGLDPRLPSALHMRELLRNAGEWREPFTPVPWKEPAPPEPVEPPPQSLEEDGVRIYDNALSWLAFLVPAPAEEGPWIDRWAPASIPGVANSPAAAPPFPSQRFVVDGDRIVGLGEDGELNEVARVAPGLRHGLGEVAERNWERHVSQLRDDRSTSWGQASRPLLPPYPIVEDALEVKSTYLDPELWPWDVLQPFQLGSRFYVLATPARDLMAFDLGSDGSAHRISDLGLGAGPLVLRGDGAFLIRGGGRNQPALFAGAPGRLPHPVPGLPPEAKFRGPVGEGCGIWVERVKGPHPKRPKVTISTGEIRFGTVTAGGIVGRDVLAIDDEEAVLAGPLGGPIRAGHPTLHLLVRGGDPPAVRVVGADAQGVHTIGPWVPIEREELKDCVALRNVVEAPGHGQGSFVLAENGRRLIAFPGSSSGAVSFDVLDLETGRVLLDHGSLEPLPSTWIGGLARSSFSGRPYWPLSGAHDAPTFATLASGDYESRAIQFGTASAWRERLGGPPHPSRAWAWIATTPHGTWFCAPAYRTVKAEHGERGQQAAYTLVFVEHEWVERKLAEPGV